ncbi:MAG: hypothetical protein ABI081_02895 [Burkholderiaceae bacterium]
MSDVIEEVMNSYRGEGIELDEPRARQAEALAFTSLPVPAPGDCVVQAGPWKDVQEQGCAVCFHYEIKQPAKSRKLQGQQVLFQ